MNQSFVYYRTINFRDTDAAGVVYFANALSFCHEAYEASLAASGINLKSFFRGEAIAVPITQASIDFLKPMFCGDRLAIFLAKTLLSPESFQIEYQLFFEGEDIQKKAIAMALTKHTCIDTSTRKRCKLSDQLLQWIEFTQ
ncbi:acyl-CoA thioesterase [Pseudanabaena sp. FACHB-1998]|uniref:acyl-CoA thioesterase n=1 Tax=Pseudanabaena sp. FACHB-1998 TaxID=2692858 RepID=UPI001681B22E|nr:thioesterase family protein [Pseudanabaena sp. FACHB-1998]MBD2176351.1 acyl-CoA thioesterase [Pseudanabaena sp. FACHB-1998]